MNADNFTKARIATPQGPLEVSSRWELVTPEIAQHYLENNLGNRTLRPEHAERIQHDMETGGWLTTHQGIAFGVDGQLKDGQHRLLALVNAGVPQTMLVTRGLPAEAKAVMDTGLKRQVYDFVFDTRGKSRADAVRTLVALQKGSSGTTVSVTPRELKAWSKRVTNADIVRFVDDNYQEVHDWLKFAPFFGKFAKRASHVSEATLLAACGLFGEGPWIDEFHKAFNFEGLADGSPIRSLLAYANAVPREPLNHPQESRRGQALPSLKAERNRLLSLKMIHREILGETLERASLGPDDSVVLPISRLA